MNLILDVGTLRQEEIDIIQQKFINFEIYLVDGYNEYNINGNRTNTIYISRSNKNVLICDEDENTYPLFIQISTDVWTKDDYHVDAKVSSVEDILCGNFYTLFGEKLAMLNNYSQSINNSEAMYYLDNILVKNEDGFVKNYDIDIYCLGRFYGRSNREDTLDIFSSKIETKYSAHNRAFCNLKLYLKNCFDFYLQYLSNESYDYYCYPPSKQGQWDRFEDAIDFNILNLKREYGNMKKKNLTERKNEVDGAFSIKDNVDVYGKNILIFDDVITTGSTVKEIAKILYSAGAAKVTVLSVAHTFQSNLNKKIILCPECNKKIKMRFKNANGDAFIRCTDDACAFYRRCLDCMAFINYRLIYGAVSLQYYIDKNIK